MVDDEAETVYKTSNLASFHNHEALKSDIVHNPGPLKDFLMKISEIQKLEQEQILENPSYKPFLRISIVTARNAPAHKRAINTMRAWKINLNEAFFLGGIDKVKVLNVLKPHIFFDDQRVHLEESAKTLPSVHIPFGIANR